MLVGCLTFVPWVPTFLYQAHHTGTPWAKPADFAAMVNAVTSFAGGATNQGRALALVYFALVGLGLFGAARGPFHVDLDLRTRPRGRALAVVLTGTLAAAVVGGYVSRSAFQARYASVVFVPLVLLVALGLVTFADRRIRAGVLTATVAFGLASGLPSAWTSRTQAGEVAAALAQLGRPGDIVAYLPGPDRARRQSPAPPRSVPPDHLPTRDGPGVRGLGRLRHGLGARGIPSSFAGRLERISEPAHQIWLVWAPGYQTFGTKCEQTRGGSARRHVARGPRDVPLRAGVGLLDHLREHGVGPLRPRRLTADGPPMVRRSHLVAVAGAEWLMLLSHSCRHMTQETVQSSAHGRGVSVVLARVRRQSNLPAMLTHETGRPRVRSRPSLPSSLVSSRVEPRSCRVEPRRRPRPSTGPAGTTPPRGRVPWGRDRLLHPFRGRGDGRWACLPLTPNRNVTG